MTREEIQTEIDSLLAQLTAINGKAHEEDRGLTPEEELERFRIERRISSFSSLLRIS